MADIIGIPGPNNAAKSVGSLKTEIMNTVRTNFRLLTTKLDGGLDFMVKTTKAVKTRTDVVEQRWAKFNQLYMNLESKIKTLEANQLLMRSDFQHLIGKSEKELAYKISETNQ